MTTTNFFMFISAQSYVLDCNFTLFLTITFSMLCKLNIRYVNQSYFQNSSNMITSNQHNPKISLPLPIQSLQKPRKFMHFCHLSYYCCHNSSFPHIINLNILENKNISFHCQIFNNLLSKIISIIKPNSIFQHKFALFNVLPNHAQLRKSFIFSHFCAVIPIQ